MAFKKNITITIALVISEIIISLAPSFLMIYIFDGTHQIQDLLFILLMIPLSIIGINFILFIISLVARLFLRTTYYIKNSSLEIKKNGNIKTIEYNAIGAIKYDFGRLTHYYPNRLSKLIFFDREFNVLTTINNPSLIMIIFLKKRCNKIKIQFYKNTRFLYFLIIINAIVLLSLLYDKILSNH